MIDIRKICYELYKKDWKKNHGITNEVEDKTFEEFIVFISEECDIETAMTYSYEGYLEEFGYKGEIYVCFDEFIDIEYTDGDYIRSLLSKDKTLLKLYNEDITGITKEDIYNDICGLLTAYEEHEDMNFETEFYELLCLIQHLWEDIITVQEG